MTSSKSSPALNLSLISELNTDKDLWNMKARVVRKWRQPYQIDLILIDEQGNKIQAGIKRELMPLFDNLLQEDAVVILNRFGIGENKDKYKVVQHDYRISFYRCTTVELVHGWQGVEYAFNFTSLDKINSGAANELLSVDVCGVIIGNNPMNIYGKPPNQFKRLMCQLEDLEGNVTTCTLWNDYAQQVSDFIASNSANECVVAIIQHAKVKPCQGELQVQSDKFSSRIFLNEEINETNDLRRRLLLKHSQGGGSTSQITLSSQTAYPLRDEFVIQCESKHIDEIIDSKMPCTCVVLGTIKMVEEKHGWFYAGCRSCNKKVLSKKEFLEKFAEVTEEILNLPTNALICPKCKTECKSITPKYKVQVRVQDETGSVSFVLFDSHVTKMLGTGANEIRERQLSSDDTESFPHELNRLLNLKLAFKIEVTDYNLKNEYHVYTVCKICNDPEIIKELVGSDDNAEEVSQGDLEMKPVHLSESSQDAGHMMLKDVVSVTADSSSVTLQNDSDSSPTAKRTIIQDDNTVNPGELSSTAKRSRKKPAKFQE